MTSRKNLSETSAFVRFGLKREKITNNILILGHYSSFFVTQDTQLVDSFCFLKLDGGSQFQLNIVTFPRTETVQGETLATGVTAVDWVELFKELHLWINIKKKKHNSVSKQLDIFFNRTTARFEERNGSGQSDAMPAAPGDTQKELGDKGTRTKKAALSAEKAASPCMTNEFYQRGVRRSTQQKHGNLVSYLCLGPPPPSPLRPSVAAHSPGSNRRSFDLRSTHTCLASQGG